MKESSGENYQSSQFEKGTYLAEAKVGKTCFLVSSALGVLPNQVRSGVGGIVDRPSHLHVIAIDAGAMSGVMGFMTKTLSAPPEVAKIQVYNMKDDIDKMVASDSDYDLSFYNAYVVTLQRIREKVAAQGGVHAVITSSLTGLAAMVERGIVGKPGSAGARNSNGEISGKGYSDPSKWKAFAQQMSQLRLVAQVDEYHCIWEGHVDTAKPFDMKGGGGPPKETVAISGQTGRNWSFNTEHVFRIRRNHGDTWEGTECQKVHLDTRPDMDFIAGGRGYTENLKPKEFCLTSVYSKLGLRVGNWGAKKVKSKREESNG